jgi:ATP-binding cassette subfamily B protein
MTARTLTVVRPDEERDLTHRPLSLGLIRRLLAYTNAHKAQRNALIVAVLFRSLQLPLLAWTIGAVINGPIAHRNPAGIVWGTLGFFALALFTQITFHFRQRWALELGETVVHDLRMQLWDHLQRLPMSFYHRTKLGRVISRMTSDAEAVRVGIQDVFFVGLVGLGQMLVAGAFMLWCDWQMFCIVLLMAPALWVFNLRFRNRMGTAYRNVQESFSRVTSNLAESVNGIRVTQGFSRQQVNAELFQDLVQDHSRYNLEAAKASGVLTPLLDLNNQLFVAILLVLGGYRVLSPDPSMRLGDLIQFFFLTGQFFQPIQILANQYTQALTAMAGAERVFQLLDTPPDWHDAPSARDLPMIHGAVEFDHVSFEYQPFRPVLCDVSFRAEPGQTIALVGHTGSGKTTITQLIGKFYLPTAGSVRVDGHDLSDITGDSLHKQLGMVAQQNFLFTGTVLENIRLAKPHATEAEVVQAAEALGIADMIWDLPHGFHTECGQRGASLSAGMRQLICFVRAMLVDPRIMILDEATSAVDCLTEQRIQAALARLLAGRTSFVVAHRLSTIRQADQILVLEHGQLVEQGTHSQLLEADGHYAQLHDHFVTAAA